MKKKLVAGILTLALGMVAMTGCGSTTQPTNQNQSNQTVESSEVKPEEPTKKGVKVQIVGSTTVAEPMEKLAAKYKDAGAVDNLEVQGNGSSAGIKAAIDGTADIGMSSRELKEEEKAEAIDETVIAHDGIAVMVHPNNAVANLTKEQIKGIFEGEITNWNQVGGADQDIIVVTREAGSGTRGAFEEILKLVDDNKASTITEIALVADSTGAIMTNVATKEAAIGFVSAGYLDETVKAVDVEGVACTIDNVKAGTYSISRPLLLVTAKEAKAEAVAFIDFILSDAGQEVIAEKYIPVN